MSQSANLRSADKLLMLVVKQVLHRYSKAYTRFPRKIDASVEVEDSVWIHLTNKYSWIYRKTLNIPVAHSGSRKLIPKKNLIGKFILKMIRKNMLKKFSIYDLILIALLLTENLEKNVLK